MRKFATSLIHVAGAKTMTICFGTKATQNLSKTCNQNFGIRIWNVES
jgi:hypothetical protein